jgi:pimeloyl-ACP methyl ester carboxylesterase
MKNHYLISTILLLFAVTIINAEDLKPGFQKSEYAELLKISARQVNLSMDQVKAPAPEKFSFVYRSPEIGLSNQWDLWVSTDSMAVVSIRGTTANMTSWLANFYAAMVPAKGSVTVADQYDFKYHFSDDPKAAVHTGWLVATAFIVRDALPKIDSLYKSGTKNIYIMGHSQGGAISFLLTSHLWNMRETGKLPPDLKFKTYCSAAPKPGNLYYAYHFENMTDEGWAYNVVNAADWVPEMPVTIQTVRDYNNVNPFVNALPAIKKQKFWQRIILKKVYKRLSKPPRKSQEDYQRYLGDRLFFLIKKQLPGFVKPKYFSSTNYVRTGKTIVLMPDEEYATFFPDNNSNVFMHHFFEPYFFLLQKYQE